MGGLAAVGLFIDRAGMRVRAKIGIVFSTVGPYSAMGRDCRDGADLALLDIAADPACPVTVEAVHADPGGDPRRYLDAARDMLREGAVRHIMGAVTSLARKDMIPLVEKHDGLLWYTCPYEGFEANENVIYTGACPNQHLMPLFSHLLPRQGKRAYLLGANYVWGWEMNRLARDLLTAAGGEVLGERYLPLEETEVSRLIADIARRQPDFILNNLIGPASHAFLAAFRDLGLRDPAFRPEACPVLSCDLSECELADLEPGLAEGHLAAAAYFDSLKTPANAAFKARVAALHGPDRRVSAYFEGAYTAVRLFAEAVALAGSDAPGAVRAALHGGVFATPHGPLRIDPRTNHAALPFHLGRINGSGGFDIIASRPSIAADPYLVADRTGAGRAGLRVVS